MKAACGLAACDGIGPWFSHGARQAFRAPFSVGAPQGLGTFTYVFLGEHGRGNTQEVGEIGRQNLGRKNADFVPIRGSWRRPPELGSLMWGFIRRDWGLAGVGGIRRWIWIPIPR